MDLSTELVCILQFNMRHLVYKGSFWKKLTRFSAKKALLWYWRYNLEFIDFGFWLVYSKFDYCICGENLRIWIEWKGTLLELQVKGQIISECPYEIIVYPKIATKKFPRFLPWPLRRGQIKKIRALYYTN